MVRLDEDDHLIVALLLVHHFIMASLAKSLQGFQMWFVLMDMVYVMMMMNYNGEDGDPSLLVKPIWPRAGGGTLCPPCHVFVYISANTRTSALKKLDFSQS